MPKIIYVDHDGAEYPVDVPIGHSIMEGARDNDIAGIVAECGGGLACATCHIYISPPWSETLRPPQDDEAAMVEFAVDPTVESRLACQITVDESMDGLVVQMPQSQI